MPTSHLTSKKIAQYLAGRLSLNEEKTIEVHVQTCRRCLNALNGAQQLDKAIGPALKDALGTPSLPPRLKNQVRHALSDRSAQHTQYLRNQIWGYITQSVRLASPLIVILLLGLAAWSVLRPPQAEVITGQINQTATSTNAPASSTPTATQTPTVPATTPTLLNTATPESSESETNSSAKGLPLVPVQASSF